MTSRADRDKPRKRPRYKACKVCGVTAASGAQLSSRGKCSPCGERLLSEAVRAMHDKSGPAYDQWRRRLLEAALGAAGGGVVVALDGGVSCKASHAVDDASTMGSSHPAAFGRRAG